MFNGYLELDGVPLINSEATEAYVAHLLPNSALKPTIKSTNIHIANEEEPYRTPLLDEAPWLNVLEQASHDFLGFYPIDISGLDDDAIDAGVTEYLSDGGSVGLQRRTSRQARVTGILIGRTQLAAAYGRDWLAASLRADGCTDCNSGTLRYFVADPDVCETGAFGAETGSDGRAFGLLGPGTYRYRFPSDRVPELMPMRVRWEATWAEGTAIRYGASEMEGVGEYQSSPVVQPLRRNYARNPTFRNTLTDWSGSGGTFTRLETGGIGNGTYARAVSAGGTVTVTGGTHAIGAGAAILGIALRGTNPVTVTVLNGATVLASTTLTPTAEWARYQLPLTAPAAALTITVATTGAVDLDQVVLEAGSYSGDYFDGSAAITGYVTTWEGPTDSSIARAVRSIPNEIARDDSRFRPFLQIVSGQATNTQLTWYRRFQQGMADQLRPYERNLFDVASTSGLSVLREIVTENQGTYIQVEFDLVAGNPAPYSLPESVNTTPLANALFTDPEDDTPLEDIAWLTDPNAVTVTLAPAAPKIVNPAIESITNWRRYYVPIPATAIASSADSVPTVAITSKANPITQVRVRFHPNPFAWPAAVVDATAYCGEFVVSYLPALTRLEVDGVLEQATASRGDRSETNADHLLYGPGGGPIAWPALSCAIAYLMTVDVPVAATIDDFTLEVALRRKH